LKIEINKARENDYELLSTIYLKERTTTFYWIDSAKFQVKDFERDTKDEFILTAKLDNVTVGFISLYVKANFIHHLYVDQKFHGKGIGTALLEAAKKKLHFPLTLKCLENNTKAVSFYLKNGFVQRERGLSHQGAYILFELLK